MTSVKNCYSTFTPEEYPFLYEKTFYAIGEPIPDHILQNSLIRKNGFVFKRYRFSNPTHMVIKYFIVDENLPRGFYLCPDMYAATKKYIKKDEDFGFEHMDVSTKHGTISILVEPSDHPIFCVFGCLLT